MTAEQFRIYQAELGGLTHGATADLLGVSEVSVKRYATKHPIPQQTAKLLRALVLLHRLNKIDKLNQMA